MELSILKLQPPPSTHSVGERRRRIRHKLHSPVYASFNGPNAGMVRDLSELLDLSEEGFSVQTNAQLDLNRVLRLSLDLPETKAVIHGTGQVIWSDRTGRVGIRFADLSEPSRRIIKHWLFVNLLVASYRHTARPRPVETHALTSAPQPLVIQPAMPDAVPFELTTVLEEIQQELRGAPNDVDAALYAITKRVLTLTGASGAALAFLTDDRMICRAAAGEPALPLGTAVDVTQGITGECVSTGKMVTCPDTETDTRVDLEICRALEIRSILAAPIVFQSRAVGLLEVFSPRAGAFTEVHQLSLEKLVALIPQAHPGPQPTEDAVTCAPDVDVPLVSTRDALWEREEVAQESLKGVPVRVANIWLLALALAAVALASGYLLAPKIEKLWLSKKVSAASPLPSAPVRSLTHNALPKSFEELRKLAEQGDAEAQYEMGGRYRNGEGVPQNDAQAARWFEKAATQGHLNAETAMGAAYWAGRGIPKDLSKSYFWSVLAADQGDETSAARLQGLALHMSAAEVAAAQAQADEWLHRQPSSK